MGLGLVLVPFVLFDDYISKTCMPTLCGKVYFTVLYGRICTVRMQEEDVDGVVCRGKVEGMNGKTCK